MEKKKITQLPLASSLQGLLTLGVDSNNRNVAVSLDFVQQAADGANAAKDNASKAVEDAQAAVQVATEASTNATKAVETANTASAAADDAAKSASEAAASASAASAKATTAASDAQQAASMANSAATSATSASASANEATTKATSAASDAQQAATMANSSATSANEAATSATSAATSANDATTKATEAATSATAQAESARSAGAYAEQAAENAIEAANTCSSYGAQLAEARQGSTVRFGGMVDVGDEYDLSSDADESYAATEVKYSNQLKCFVVQLSEDEFSDVWKGSELYNSYGTGTTVQKDKVYIYGDTLYAWSDTEDTLVEASAGGKVDLTAIESKIATAQKAADGAQTSADTAYNIADAARQAAAGAVKRIILNGTQLQMGTDGEVTIAINDIAVDESLDADSTNPVENRAVTAKLNELEGTALYGATAELSDDGGTVHLSLTDKNGAEAIGVDFPAGSGGGSGDSDSSSTKVVLSATVDKSTVKEGDTVTLNYSFDHQYSSGDDKGQTTGQKGSINISVRRGTTEMLNTTVTEVSRGSYALDLTKLLLVGTNDIYVVATATDPSTGKTQKKQIYISVKVVSLTLTSSYNLVSSLATGGYASSDTIEIPYAVSGSGTKNVALYVDGSKKETQTVTRSGTTNGSFTIAASTMSEGYRFLQLVAELDTDDGTITSDSILIGIWRRGDSASAFVCAKIIYSDGRIIKNRIPTLEVGQYEACSFDFVAYDPEIAPATVKIYRDDTLQRTVLAARTLQTYSNRFTEQGKSTISFSVAGVTRFKVSLTVTASSIDISEATYGQVFKLDAAGRSNDEAEPAVWASNGVETTFEDVDWGTNGWINDTLKLTNGAKAVINYKPFATDVKSTGMTLEMTMRVSNVTDRSGSVISCINEGKGMLITTQEASFKTGQTVTYTNEDDEVVSRETKLATNYAADEWIKVALVIRTTADNRLMELFINGNRTGADIYDSAFSFKHETPQAISIESEAADVEIKNVRVYNRALSDDEELDNRIVDCDTTDEMVEIYEANDIIGESGEIDMDILRGKGKGVLRIVRTGKLDDVFETNNKKTDFTADIYYYSALGEEYDFVLLNCYIRIQGTSSTKYPSKNIRIYCSKGTELLSMSGMHVSSGNKYAMRAGARAMNMFCLKSDYSDSSMSLNTGGAKLFNDMMKELGLLTPPQQYQYDQTGSMSDVTVRTAIDGMPIDVFVAETTDGENTYVGQYNFNNEKSKSGVLFGMEGVDGYTPECPLTLEMLNNTSPVCLFQSTSDTDLVTNFDAGAEVNYGIDANGKAQTDGDIAWSGLGSAAQTAVKTLWSWIRDCVPAGATADDLSTFKSTKFKTEVSGHFDVGFLLCYYLWTDYNISVDQRAKNMMLRTWDGIVWYITYYDGDTQLGKRNDCFLVYGYTTDRNTYDAEASKYAFEGRESWLWNLVLANLEDELKEWATKMRAVLTNTKVLAMFNDEQSGNWSDRAFNKSGYLKYIQPAIQTMYGKIWPFIYALQGSNKSHRTFLIENRYALLDAKYGTNNFTSDNIDLYMSRTASDAADILKITAGEIYAFGYGTNNSPNIANTGLVEAGTAATVSISGAYTVNDPLRVYGASRIKILDMTAAASHLKNGLELSKCTQLQELNLSAASGKGSTGWWITLDSCLQLRRIYLTNQTQAKTGSSTSTALDLSSQTKLTTLEAGGTSVRSVVFAKGAPVTKVILPSTLTSLRLEYLAKLTPSGLTVESYSSVQTLIVNTCPQLDWKTLYESCTGLKQLRVTGMTLKGTGSELQDILKRGLEGIDAEGSVQDRPVVEGTYYLTQLMDEAEIEDLQSGIEGLYFALTLEACIAIITQMNGEAYSGEEEVEAPTLDTIEDEFVRYNGEDYDDYVARYATDNRDINDLVLV